MYKPGQLFWATGDNEWRSLGPSPASRGADLGWDDVVSNIPEPLPQLRGVGEDHALDFGDDAALQ